MKIKSETVKRGCTPKLKSSSTLRFKLCFCVLSLPFLAICSATSFAGDEIPLEHRDPLNLLDSLLVPSLQDVNALDIAWPLNTLYRVWSPPIQAAKLQQKQHETQPSSNAAVNFTAQIDKKIPQSSLIISKSPNTQSARKLWQARISAPKRQKSNKSKNELQRIVGQIRAVEFKPQDKTPKSLIVVEPTPKSEPNETLSDTAGPKETEGKKVELKQDTAFYGGAEGGKEPLGVPCDKSQDVNTLAYEPVTDETLQILKNLLQNPEQLKNSFELAEVLFRCGCIKEAGACYQQALSQKGQDKVDLAQNTAWILFQIGTCLRNDDPPKAVKMYRRLVTEYADSPWTDLAKVHIELIEWYQQDKPRTLISENQF